MTAPDCATGCKRPSPNAIICGGCADSLRATLTMAASIEGDLLDAVARQLRHGHGKNSGSEPPLPYDPAASDARRALAFALADAVWHLDPDRWPIAEASIGGTARWLMEHVTDLAASPRAARDYHAIRAAVDRCLKVLDAPPELHPAGDCPCGAPLRAEPSADEARCGKCGAVTEGIAAARAQRAAEADVLGTSDVIAAALAGIGVKVAGGTIRKWVERHRLTPRPGGAIAMSDVLALVAERDARKAG